ncbi:hypothetical protein [Achromobacter ruhlandii]|uniref:hypothetical protein n=1 Tax=Achromobacter ruhlandii TaxID=72557 RepID=UPI001EED934E|nr:hypothetical protein [Achromobacter ruhlandii]
MQSLLTDTLLPSPAPTGNDPRATVRRDADAAQDRDAAQSAEKPVSIRVILSDEALERAAKARKAAFQMATEATQSRQDLARARVAQIKQRIDTLKKMLMFLGAAAAKAILRELRQLAGELGQAASALKDSGGAPAATGAAPGAAAPVVHGADGPAAPGASDGAQAVSPADTANDADGAEAASAEAGPAASTAATARALAAYATVGDTATAVDADAGPPAADVAAQGAAAAARADAAKGASVPGETDKADDQADQAAATAESRQDPQAAQKRRENDAQAVREAIRAMKELLAMLKSKLRQHDKDAQKQVHEIQHDLDEATKTAQAIEDGGLDGVQGGAMNVGGADAGGAMAASA